MHREHRDHRDKERKEHGVGHFEVNLTRPSVKKIVSIPGFHGTKIKEI